MGGTPGSSGLQHATRCEAGGTWGRGIRGFRRLRRTRFPSPARQCPIPSRLRGNFGTACAERDGTYRSVHEPYMEFYASPVDILTGPCGWPTYVARGTTGWRRLHRTAWQASWPRRKRYFFPDFGRELQRNSTDTQCDPRVTYDPASDAMNLVRQSHIAANHLPHRKHRNHSGHRHGAMARLINRSSSNRYWTVGVSSATRRTAVRHVSICAVLGRKAGSGVMPDVHRERMGPPFRLAVSGGVSLQGGTLHVRTVRSRLWEVLQDENHREVVLPTDEERTITPRPFSILAIKVPCVVFFARSLSSVAF